MEQTEIKTRRYFHESRLPEILFTINNEIFTGYMTDFSDDEVRIACSSDIPIKTATIVAALYLKETNKDYKLEKLPVRRVRKNQLTEQMTISLFLVSQEQINRFRAILKKMLLLNDTDNKGSFELKTFPWFPGASHYSDKAIKKRQDWLEKTANVTIQALNQSVFYAPTLSGNIENYIGAVQVPVGIAGPIKVNGVYTVGYIPLPIATTEGALVSSITRGAMATNMAGGIDVHVIKQQMIRAPAFFFEDIHGAVSFEKWILEHEQAIAKEAEKMSSVAKLVQIIPFLFGDTVHLKFHFRTGDAAGQNMTTSCTWAAAEWIVEQIKEDPYIKYKDYIIDGNLAGDKKVTAQNFLMGRGVTVTGTCFISGQILQDVLRVNPDDYLKNYQAGEVAGLQSGMVGHNINFANVIAGIFTATGQDIASVHESSCGILKARKQGDGIHFTVYLPSLVIGTIGGGTGLPTQKENLKIMGCYGQKQLFRLAEIIAAGCLALDLSTGSAVTSKEFVSAHERLGRNRNNNHLAKSEINAAFFNQLLLDKNQRVVESTAIDLDCNEGLVSHLTSKSNSGVTGIFKYMLSIQHLKLKEQQELATILKLKATHRDAIKAASTVVKLSGDDLLPGYFESYSPIFGFDDCDVRELAFYQEIAPRVRSFCPKLYGIQQDSQREIFGLLLEDLSSFIQPKSSNNNTIWTNEKIKIALRDLAKVHSTYFDAYETIPKPLKIVKFKERFATGSLVLIKGVLDFNAQNHPSLISKELHQKLLTFIGNFEQHINTMDGYHKTLIHNDCNARNSCIKTENNQSNLVLFDWELAAYHNPQRDLIEFLASTLSANASKADFLDFVAYYQNELAKETGVFISNDKFMEILQLNAYECTLIRLNLYLLVHNLMKLDYINQLYKNVIRFGIE